MERGEARVERGLEILPEEVEDETRTQEYERREPVVSKLTDHAGVLQKRCSVSSV